ncbi:SdrD B-like domain-containing protein, partial [Neptunomonas sp.]|uniref:SdrD B-like domain-containing protein n=1 Tax=Neptunomonas sp. TaxID=1971898 RepID=UPI0025FF843E
MSTMTIRVTSSAVNEEGTGFGEQPDLGAPSFWDVIISDSTNSDLPNGTYDGYCLHPELPINFSPSEYQGDASNGQDIGNYLAADVVSSITETQISQINWLLSQNFTSDTKYAGQFNYGEMQAAIWEVMGFTPAQYNTGINPGVLSDNGRQVVETADVSFLVSQSQAAVDSGINVVPSDTFFSMVVDPDGVQQPLIIQLQSAKLGNYVWLDADQDGIQDANELGVDGVVVELYDAAGTLITSTITGDDYSTVETEVGFYQFTGLDAGDYTVKFLTPANMVLTAADAASNTQDDSDSDADEITGMTATISLAQGESNQSVDAGLVEVVLPASLGDTVFEDSNANGIQDAGETGIENLTV